MNAPHRTRFLPLAALVTLGSVTLAACGDDDAPAVEGAATTVSAAEETSTTSTTPAPSEPTTTATSAATPGATGGPSTPVSAAPAPELEATALLSDVGAFVGGDVDDVTFTFEGDELPGYDVRYVEAPISESASGDPIAVEGAAFLSVRMEPASAFDMEAGAEVYAGPDRIAIDGAVIREVVRTGDFEANLEWVIGVTERRPFTVRTETSPTRLIVAVGG